ncbi:MAG: DUF4388 domain-containing protein [Planctomycetota bacterium]
MSSELLNSEIWFHARACRRLAAAIAIKGGEERADRPAIDAVVSHLAMAADQLGALTGPRSARLPRWLVENMLATALTPPDHAAVDASPDHEPVLCATGAFCSVGDLVSFLHSVESTGILEVVTAPERFTIEFVSGFIVHAESDRAPAGQRLGDILVEQGAVGREALEALMATGPAGRIGQLLLAHGLVDTEQLVVALEEQIHRLFGRLLAATADEVTYWSGPPIRAHEHMCINTTGLMLESARLRDERQRG